MLTDVQRDRLRCGGAPRIVYPGDKPCPVVEGQIIEVAANLELRIDKIKRGRKGEHVLSYTIRDHRVQLIRRVPPIYAAPEVDSDGYPVPPDREAIAKARMESAITSSPALAVPDAGEAVPGEYQNVVNVKARAKDAQRRREADPSGEGAVDASQVNAEVRDLVRRAARAGIDPLVVLAPVAREIRSQHEAISGEIAA